MTATVCNWPLTYSFARWTGVAWLGVLCSDSACEHALYESWTPCVTQEHAERVACDEWTDALELAGKAGAA